MHDWELVLDDRYVGTLTPVLWVISWCLLSDSNLLDWVNCFDLCRLTFEFLWWSFSLTFFSWVYWCWRTPLDLSASILRLVWDGWWLNGFRQLPPNNQLIKIKLQQSSNLQKSYKQWWKHYLLQASVPFYRL